MDELINAMKVLSATNFSFYLKLHFFHWNVEGPNFPQYHKFFEGLYEEIFDNVDIISEHIRAIGGYAPGSLSRFNVLSKIDDQITVVPAYQMIQTALNDNEIVIDCLKECYFIANGVGEVGLSNYLQDRIDQHKKHGWMLRATGHVDPNIEIAGVK